MAQITAMRVNSKMVQKLHDMSSTPYIFISLDIIISLYKVYRSLVTVKATQEEMLPTFMYVLTIVLCVCVH